MKNILMYSNSKSFTRLTKVTCIKDFGKEGSAWNYRILCEEELVVSDARGQTWKMGTVSIWEKRGKRREEGNLPFSLLSLSHDTCHPHLE